MTRTHFGGWHEASPRRRAQWAWFVDRVLSTLPVEQRACLVLLPDTLEQGLPSLCLRQCGLTPSGFCRGCGRTAQEIAEWSAMPMPRRLDVARLASERLGCDPFLPALLDVAALAPLRPRTSYENLRALATLACARDEARRIAETALALYDSCRDRLLVDGEPFLPLVYAMVAMARWYGSLRKKTVDKPAPLC